MTRSKKHPTISGTVPREVLAAFRSEVTLAGYSPSEGLAWALRCFVAFHTLARSMAEETGRNLSLREIIDLYDQMGDIGRFDIGAHDDG